MTRQERPFGASFFLLPKCRLSFRVGIDLIACSGVGRTGSPGCCHLARTAALIVMATLPPGYLTRAISLDWKRLKLQGMAAVPTPPKYLSLGE